MAVLCSRQKNAVFVPAYIRDIPEAEVEAVKKLQRLKYNLQKGNVESGMIQFHITFYRISVRAGLLLQPHIYSVV